MDFEHAPQERDPFPDAHESKGIGIIDPGLGDSNAWLDLLSYSCAKSGHRKRESPRFGRWID